MSFLHHCGPPRSEKSQPDWLTFCFCGGVGGVRTLVQTKNSQGFYMFSLWLIFDRTTDKDTQCTAYLLRSRTFHGAGLVPAWKFEFPGSLPNRRRRGRKYLFDLLYFERIKPYSLGELSSKCVWRVVNYCSRQDIKELHLNALHAYTWSSLLLSNPKNDPNVDTKIR